MISQGCLISFLPPNFPQELSGKEHTSLWSSRCLLTIMNWWFWVSVSCHEAQLLHTQDPQGSHSLIVPLESSFTVVWQAHNRFHIFKVVSADVSMLLKPPTQSRQWTHPSLTKFPLRSLGNFIHPWWIPGHQWCAFHQYRVVCIFYNSLSAESHSTY